MSYKEEFYNKVSKFLVNELKSFLEKENYTFDDFRKEYQSWKAEEERYKKRLDKLDKPKQIILKIWYYSKIQSNFRCYDYPE